MRTWAFLAAILVLGIAAAVAWQAGLFNAPSPTTASTDSASSSNAEASAPTPTGGRPWFDDVAKSAGIDFKHYDPATPMHYIQETMGSGLAWIDYNADGWPDLFCVQDGTVRPDSSGGPGLTSRLYRNNGDGTFTDVTEQVGLTHTGYGMGCAVGDYDNDGYDDLVVTYMGGVVLYHNEPDGKGGRHFVDVTEKAGLKDPHWATSCGWGDIDGDGKLDLYICNYVVVDIDPQHYPFCGDEKTKVRSSCPPTIFTNVPHKLFRNNGNGTFTDISESSGIASVSPAPGLAVILADLDDDGKIDIYAANDLKPGYLFHNQGGGRFVEKGLLSGCALGPMGILIAGMGVEAGDLDGSGRLSLFVTNFQHKPDILFRNKGNLQFQEWSNPSGLGAPSLNRLGFGTVFIDADLDGTLDIAVANGHISRVSNVVSDEPFQQEAQFFRGLGNAKFQDLSNQTGPYFREKRVGRGLAWADYDNDGKPDLAFSHNGGPIALLHNATPTDNHWLMLELVGDGKKSNRNAIGARVELQAGGQKQTRYIHGGGSYLSASDRRLLFGLGKADRAERITVRWPNGDKQELGPLTAGRWYRLTQGQKDPVPVTPQRPKVGNH
jgi:enediyne biosynthesis protein E4